MALEDRIDKLTATLERLLDAMKATTGSAPGNAGQDGGPVKIHRTRKRRKPPNPSPPSKFRRPSPRPRRKRRC